MNANPNRYICVDGHNGNLEPDSELGRLCSARLETGGMKLTDNGEADLSASQCPQCLAPISSMVGEGREDVVDHRSFDETYYDGHLQVATPLHSSPSSFRIGF